jgi:hypothetical protein
MSLAWHTAALQRGKSLPTLAKLLKRKDSGRRSSGADLPEGRQPQAEMARAVRAWRFVLQGGADPQPDAKES